MSSFSPIAEGFRLIFRRPAIPFAEIAWRWTFATAAWLIGLVFLLEYMGSLTVTGVDRLLLGTQQPALIAQALHRIFQGSALRFTEAGIVVLIAIGIAWLVLASLGRAAVLTAVLEEFGIVSTSGGAFVRSLFALNFLRIAIALAAVVAGIGAAVIASSFWASTHVAVEDAARLWFAGLFMCWIMWVVLNWLLSLAAVFAATDNNGSLSAIASSARFCAEQPGRVLAAGIWFGLAHLGALIVAFMAGITTLSVIGAWQMRAALVLEFLIVIAYCSVADFLYAGRLAAYVAMLRGDEVERSLLSSPMMPGAGSTSVDRDELILCDVPLLAT